MNTHVSQTKRKTPVTIAFSMEKQASMDQLAALRNRSRSLVVQDRVIDVLHRLQRRRVRGTGRRSVIGLWYDTLLQRVVCEPSFFFFVGTSLARAAAFAADIGEHYGQQAVMLAQENPDGAGAIHQITFVSQEKAFAASQALPSFGINNATVDGPLIWIGDPSDEISPHVARFYAFAVDCGATGLRTTRAEIMLVWSQDYKKILAMMDECGNIHQVCADGLGAHDLCPHSETDDVKDQLPSRKQQDVAIIFSFVGSREDESFLTVSYRANTQRS